MSNHPPGSPPVYEQSTAEEMYQHTKNVNAYCFAEIGVDADNEGSYRHACFVIGFHQCEQEYLNR